ncbi:uncharacterized protein F4807DRAFT_470695 [Annulohypoxylon truncatum]|uniref:uncharacterized protein n=1 Tax=Annulohypoxylon truncatum TaxID=327061 RepID=UPI0020081415|nr:uncharacterized protein F4807DRAFT_470695 [Annulohypoxylon truncatum]KAI1213310.1 hypothetical protein F4807DRAFT_470695 [Annulohypoxylon truncatum]
MASSTASQSQHDITVPIRLSVDTASQNMPEPYDEMDVDDEYSSSDTSSVEDKTENIEQTEQVSRSPSPEIDPESYTTWGREHFGEEWYRQRNTMLNERNIFMSPDPVYKQRQSALRMLERQVEGRTFMLPCGMDGEPAPSPHPERVLAADDDNDLNISSPPPTPTSSTPATTLPSDPHERLEHYRKLLQWDDLEYHIELHLLSESLVDSRRSAREDALGDARREHELEHMHDVVRSSQEYLQRERAFRLRTLGCTGRRVEARGREEREERVDEDARAELEALEEMDATSDSSETEEGEVSDEDYIS